MQHTIIRAMLYYSLTHKMAAQLCNQPNKEYIHLPISISEVTYLKRRHENLVLKSGSYVSIGQNGTSPVLKIDGRQGNIPLTYPISFQFKNATGTKFVVLEANTTTDHIDSIEMGYNGAFKVTSGESKNVVSSFNVEKKVERILVFKKNKQIKVATFQEGQVQLHFSFPRQFSENCSVQYGKSNIKFILPYQDFIVEKANEQSELNSTVLVSLSNAEVEFADKENMKLVTFKRGSHKEHFYFYDKSKAQALEVDWHVTKPYNTSVTLNGDIVDLGILGWKINQNLYQLNVFSGVIGAKMKDLIYQVDSIYSLYKYKANNEEKNFGLNQDGEPKDSLLIYYFKKEIKDLILNYYFEKEQKKHG